MSKNKKETVQAQEEQKKEYTPKSEKAKAIHDYLQEGMTRGEVHKKMVADGWRCHYAEVHRVFKLMGYENTGRKGQSISKDELIKKYDVEDELSKKRGKSETIRVLNIIYGMTRGEITKVMECYRSQVDGALSRTEKMKELQEQI